MQMLLSLWLPIIVSAVAVFFASFAAWMLLPHHKKDWIKVPDEDALGQALNSLRISPGQYIFPCAENPEEMKSPEFKQRMERGPRGTLTMWPDVPSMGMNMLWTFVFFLVVSFFLAYLGSIVLVSGDARMKVFRVIGTAGVLAYTCAGIPNAIWFRRKTFTDILDGIAYGIVTGVVFALLWPAA